MSERIGARASLAQTRIAWAMTLQARGGAEDRTASAALLRQALDDAEALGMQAATQRARRLLSGADAGEVQPHDAAEAHVLRREGDYWTIAYEGSALRLRDGKGLHYLALLLRHPGRPFHALDLVTMVSPAPPGLERAGRQGALGPLLDASARADYKRRLAALRTEQDEAERHHDVGRAARAADAIDLLTEQLGAAVGLGGRARRRAGDAERARLMVTKRIRATVKRVEGTHPALAHHLATTVKTGTVCVYLPPPTRPITWAE